MKYFPTTTKYNGTLELFLLSTEYILSLAASAAAIKCQFSIQYIFCFFASVPSFSALQFSLNDIKY